MPQLEEHFMIRLPQDVAKNVAVDIADGTLGDKLQVNMTGAHERDGKCSVKYADNVELDGQLVNLPTITETLRTAADNKFFYKIADVAQIVICKHKDESKTQDQEMQIDQYGDQKLNDIPDGLTPPLKNVRNRRFRQTAKKQHDNTPEGKMRRELDELLKRDKEAHNTVFKIENPVETDVATMDDLDAFDTRSVAASATGDLAPGDAAKKAMAAGLNANSSDSDDSDNERGDKDFDAQSVSSFASHNTATTARSQALSGHGHGQGQGQHSKPGSALSIYAQSAASTPPPHATLAEASDRSSPAPTEKSGVSSIASSLKFMSGTPQDAVLDAPTPVKAQAQAQAQAPSTPQLPALGEGMDVALDQGADQGADASPSPAVAPPSPTTIKNQELLLKKTAEVEEMRTKVAKTANKVLKKKFEKALKNAESDLELLRESMS